MMAHKPPSQVTIDGDIASVFLTKGFSATIDSADAPAVAPYYWYTLIHPTTGHAYAARYDRGQCVLMHRQLLAAPKGTFVDHEDGDGLNNRRKNIRLATPSQNQANRAATRLNRLQTKGVWEQEGKPKPFKACIGVNGRTIYLGSYATREEAAAAYAGAAKVAFGDFARTE